MYNVVTSGLLIQFNNWLQDKYFNEKRTGYIVLKSPMKVKVVILFADIGQIGICYHGAKCIFFEMCIKVYISNNATLLSHLRIFLTLKTLKVARACKPKN